MRTLRTNKAVNNLYKFLFYSFSTITGWYILKDEIYLPVCLGGKGDINNIFIDFPYVERPRYYTYYFTGCMGFHFGSLL